MDILKQSVSDDPLYVYMDETFKCLISTLIHNINLMKISDFTATAIHAGDIFNNIYISDQTITDEEVKKIAIDFKFRVETTDKLKTYVIDDPLQNMFAFCHYFFIPVRFDVNSLKEQERYKALKTYLTTICSLEFNAVYLSKFVNIINTIPTLQKIIDTISNDNAMNDKIKGLNEKYVLDSLGNVFNTSNTTQIFIRTFAAVIIHMSIEVTKRYNPVIQECIKINPNYNGEWVNPFDPLFNEQIAELKKVGECCKT